MWNTGKLEKFSCFVFADLKGREKFKVMLCAHALKTRFASCHTSVRRNGSSAGSLSQSPTS